MDFGELQKAMTEYLAASEANYVQPEDAMRDDLSGMRMFDDPIFGVAAANDPLFDRMREPGAVGPWYIVPEAWLSGAKSVIAFFLPVSERARKANAADLNHLSDEWLHCRIEGQLMVNKMAGHLCELITSGGYGALAPSLDKRFKIAESGFSSNWSERHAAYICGLGTFSLSRGLITKKGMAGRLGSVVTDLELPPDRREYTGLYDYCVKCGLCASNCPVSAINPALGMAEAKSNPKCGAFLDQARSLPPRGKSLKQRYGCGKCQVGVPCECGIPGGTLTR